MQIYTKLSTKIYSFHSQAYIVKYYLIEYIYQIMNNLSGFYMQKIKALVIFFCLTFATLSSYATDCYNDPATTKLMCALINKEPYQKIQTLIFHGQDVNAVDMEFMRHYNPVLLFALNRGDDPESLKILKLLIDHGADVNGTTYHRVHNKKLFGMMPLLSYAVIHSSKDVIKLLVSSGANPFKKLPEDSLSNPYSSYEIAVILNKKEVIEYFKEIKLEEIN